MDISFFSFAGGSAQAKVSPKKVLQARTNWTFGVANYTRQSLLEALDAGLCLEIKVLGLCHFASDVNADLANEAIKSFELVGQLIASSAVSQVLRQKGK